MQPRSEPAPAHEDETALYREHNAALHHAVARRVRAPRKLIEDACQFAWMRLIDSQPDRSTLFGWLYVVAVHEAFRLCAVDRREARLEHLLGDEDGWQEIVADRRSVELAHDAVEALRALAALPPRLREDLALRVAGFSYEEIRVVTGGRTFTNVNKSLVKARTRIRRTLSR
jgi:DNA-directed RNA polymerase specialized sigma24 family protein